MMHHLLLMMYVLNVAAFFGTWIFTWILIRRFNYAYLKFYWPLFLGCFTFVCAMMVGSYSGEILGNYAVWGTYIGMVVTLAVNSFVFTIPYFIFNMYQVPKKEHFLKLFFGIMLGCVFLSFAPFSSTGNLTTLRENALQGWGNYMVILGILTSIITANLVVKRYRYVNEAAVFDTLLRHTLYLSLLFMPLFIVDLLWFECQFVWKIIPQGLFFSPFFMLFQNILVMYRSARILMAYEFSLVKSLEVKCEEYGISKREKEIIKAIYQGLSNQLIAEQFYISETTVKKHVQNIFRKIHVSSRIELVAKLSDG